MRLNRVAPARALHWFTVAWDVNLANFRARSEPWMGLQRKPGAREFHWVLHGERPQPCRVEEWRFENDQGRVPLGAWFLVEAYMKKDRRDGRVYFAINGQVVLDTDVTKPKGFTGRTEHPDNPLPLRFWSPMKNYHGMEWNAQGPVSQWYDDFELWSGFPPGHPALREPVKP